MSSGYHGKATETNPVAVISAEVYQRIFHTTAPLKRMLRRQINNAEYIALSTSELNYLATNNPADLSAISFVIPTMKQVRGGYFETQMQVVNLGKIKEVKANGTQGTSFTIYFEGRPTISLNASTQFIRWVGL